MRAVTLLLLVLSLAGCEDVLDGLIPCVASPSDLEGQWTLRGHGERTGCDDPRLNGDFTIATAAPLDVVQVPDGATGDDRLSLGTPLPGFSLDGSVADHCGVTFDVIEETPDGPVTYHFTGDPEDQDGPRIDSGRLTGEGPGTCRLTGTYTVTIEP